MTQVKKGLFQGVYCGIGSPFLAFLSRPAAVCELSSCGRLWPATSTLWHTQRHSFSRRYKTADTMAESEVRRVVNSCLSLAMTAMRMTMTMTRATASIWEVEYLGISVSEYLSVALSGLIAKANTWTAPPAFPFHRSQSISPCTSANFLGYPIPS